MRTIATEWASFEGKVIPWDAGSTQRQEMRRAFYAGAQAMLGIVHEIGSDDVSEDAGIAVLKGLADEGELFVQDVLAGRA